MRDIGLSSLEVDVRCVLGLRGCEEKTLRAIEDEFAVFIFFEQEADGICCEPEVDRDPTDTPHCSIREVADGTQRLFVLGDEVRACV